MPLRAIIWAAVSTASQTDDDKFSLPKQEADARAVCEREGWEIVDTLIVDGHSRRYKTIRQLVEASLKNGKDVFARLERHLETGDFDVFIIRDANRIARKPSLLHEIVDTIIEDCNARIFSLTDGWIDDHNKLIYTTMKAYSSAAEVDWLVNARRAGMHKRAERGLPVSPYIPISHKKIYNANHKLVGMVVDERQRKLLDDLAALILEGIPFDLMEQELYNRFGHVDAKTGNPYHRMKMYNLVTHPVFWGHIALNYNGKTRQRGDWIYDTGVDPPEPVTVYRHVTEAAWTGELADKTIFELKRRSLMRRGRGSVRNSRAFVGLFMCGECGNAMVTSSNENGRVYLRCNTAYIRGQKRCAATGYTPYAYIQSYMDAQLGKMLSRQDDKVFTGDDSDKVANLDRLRRNIEKAETQIRRMIAEQSDAPDNMHVFYREQIARLSSELDNARQALREAERGQIEQEREEQMRQVELDKLLEYGDLDQFWQQDERVINQVLLRIFWGWKFVIKDKEIVGVRRVDV